MKVGFTTVKGAKAYAKALKDEAKRKVKELKSSGLSEQELKVRSNAILAEAKRAGNESVKAAEENKSATVQQFKEDDRGVDQIIEKAKQQNIDELLIGVYSAINFGTKVANLGVGYALRNPKEAGKTLILAKKIVARVKKEFEIKNLKDLDLNAVLKSDFVSSVLSDEG
jgi:Skp family chaperone for outer membrane proteins